MHGDFPTVSVPEVRLLSRTAGWTCSVAQNLTSSAALQDTSSWLHGLFSWHFSQQSLWI